MKRFMTCYFILSFWISISGINAQNPDLLPVPQQITWGKNKFMLSEARLVITGDLHEAERKNIESFSRFVKELTGISLKTSGRINQKKPGIFLSADHSAALLPVKDEKRGSQSREAYKILVTVDKIQVSAKSDAGLFYALQTLRQLIRNEGPDSYIPEVEIEDYPCFPYRGVMMDFAHGGLLTEEEIKKQIDFLARWKMNQYYFYNEVSIEMKGYPLINYNAQYSQDQIKRIIVYARERFIDVIPFVNFYGHLHELLRLERYSGLGIGKYGHDLDPRIPEVKTILKDWITQYVDLFPGPFIHVGFDETWETARLSASDSTILPRKLFTDHLNFAAKTLQQYGKTVMVWTDMSKNYPEVIAELPKDVIPVVWDYSTDSTSIKRWIDPILKEKLPFFIQPAVDGWAHIYPTRNSYVNIDLCLNASIQNKAGGYITSVWTDAVQPLLRNSWMFMAYGSILAWQGSTIVPDQFIGKYSRIIYPSISQHMIIAFEKMAESQAYLEKCLRRHTQTEMWTNPFTGYSLQHTKDHLDDYKKARMAAEISMEALINALQYKTADTLFIKSLLVNSRQLHYTATRFLWAKTIVDRWDYSVQLPGNRYMLSYNDIKESPHGLITDILDYCTAIKEEYRQAWLSENMTYRLGTMTGRFDEEYLLWRNLASKMVEYHYNGDKKRPAGFKDIFNTNSLDIFQ